MAVKGRHGATLAGRYRLLEQLGEGGMGSVWKAEHLLLHSHVAVKIIDPEVARVEFNLARFLREAKTLASVRSPNVVQVLDFGSDAETPYLVMELLQGQTLGSRLAEQGRLSLNETCRVLQEVCAAMSLVHEQGLIHRDLKPENIFLCNVGGQRVTKVVDFGIAKSLRGDMSASMKTRTGHMLGTPSYMSPEQCRGLKDIDHRADLWALGVIAYECLVGKVPFEGEVLGDVLLRICMDPLPIPSQKAAGALPAAFDAWFAQAVARDRSARFQSALELATSLSELSPAVSSPTREPLESSRPSSARISIVPPMPLPRAPSNTETNTSVGLIGASRKVERRARVAAAAATAILAVAGLWAIAGKRDADGAVNADVKSLRPPYEVTPKLIRSGVPSGRRWQPSGTALASGAVPPSAGGGAGGSLLPAAAGASTMAAAAPGGAPLPSRAPEGAPPRAGTDAVGVGAGNAAPFGAALASTAPNAAANGVGSSTVLGAARSANPAPGDGRGSAGGESGAVLPPGRGSGGAPGSGAPLGSPPGAASPPIPRPSHGRHLQPLPPSAPTSPLGSLRGTASPAAPSRGLPVPSPPGPDTLRQAR